MEKGFEQIGVIGVDAGLCWIGDPCYILHKEGAEKEANAKVLGHNWSEFCDRIDYSKGPTVMQFNYPAGHPGLGVLVSTGVGDGVYNVLAKIKEVKGWGRRVCEVRIKFI